MGISAADGSVGILPRPDRVSGSLIRLGIAGLGAFAALAGGCALGLIMASRSDFAARFVAPFDGWQLDAVAGGFAAVLLAVFLVSVVAWYRIYGRLHARTPRAREVLFIALLPGLFLGGLTFHPMGSAIAWASNHTAAGKRAIAEARHEFGLDSASPPFLTMGQVASPSLAARVLHSSDLGAGWYDATRPNPSRLTDSLAGPAVGAGSRLGQWHWDGRMWVAGDLAFEQMYSYTTATDAQRALAILTRDTNTKILVGGVTIYELVTKAKTGSANRHVARFAIANDVFNVDVFGTEDVTHVNAIVAKAVRRATAGR